jgi:hypothetical protein
VDIEVLVGSDVRAALHAAEQLGQTSAATVTTRHAPNRIDPAPTMCQQFSG